jgi:putative ABC transport system permease protein
MLLLVSVLIRGSIISEWQQQLPEKTPNHFLINIASYQVSPIQRLLTENHVETAGMYPMVRGRLTKINGVEATAIMSESIDEIYRELNLTWSATLPEDNQLIAGKWWDSATIFKENDPRVSIEKSLAKKLKVDVGDQLTFTVGDQSFKTVIANVRELSWDKMRPNFYFIFEPGALDHYSATYITSFYLPKEQKLFLNNLLSAFPTVSIFEVDEMISRIQKMVAQVTQAIELVMGLILLAGALVLFACVQSSLDQRLQENAVLRSLGAGKRLIVGSLAIEFILLGAVAGLMAAFGSELTAWALQTQVFKMEYHVHLWLWWVGPLAGALMIGVLGVSACMKVVRVPPWSVLREGHA